MKSIFIIAEAGVNHNGDVSLAKNMIEIAAEAGADAIKFQTFKTEKIVTKDAAQAEYQQKNLSSSSSQYEMLKKLELDFEAHKILINHCQKLNITFLSTPFDSDSIQLLDTIGVAIFKIPSGEITNLPYLRHIGSLGKQIILSTGMADLGEIEDALNVLEEAGTSRKNITILHCNTMYPTPFEDVNLNAMLTIKNAFHCKVGYSDHTPGIEIAIGAAALGASIIEKHFTLDQKMEGPDHKASLEPDELKMLIKAIRNIEKAMGNGIKKPSSSETPNLPIIRKSIVAAKVIRKGEIFSESNLTVKRPATGMSPMRWDKIIGTAAQKNYQPDEMI